MKKTVFCLAAVCQVVEKVVLFQQPASEIAGIGNRYAKTVKKVMKNDKIRFENASGNFLFTSKEAVEKPLSVFQQPASSARASRPVRLPSPAGDAACIPA